QEAEEVLSKIKESVAKFEETYAHTNVKHAIQLWKLENMILNSLETLFNDYCEKNQVTEAENMLSQITEGIKRFDDNYSEARHSINLRNLKSNLTEAKERVRYLNKPDALYERLFGFVNGFDRNYAYTDDKKFRVVRVISDSEVVVKTDEGNIKIDTDNCEAFKV